MVSGVMTRLTSAALLATALTALPASASASAAANAYTPEQVCGSGFGRVSGGTQPVTDHLGVVRGQVHLLYSARTDQYCVVTIKSSFVGQPTPTRAALVRQGLFRTGSVTFPDEGNFKYYAGPVKVQANGSCYAFHGRIGNVPDGRMAGVRIRAYGGSKGFDHCGRPSMARRHG